MASHYWLMRRPQWEEVTKEEWMAAEREEGFVGGRGQEPATAGFNTARVRGRITADEKPPEKRNGPTPW